MQTNKEKRVHEVFESISGHYDRMNAVISFKRHERWRIDTMERMSVFPGASALDVCCGTADWTRQLADEAGETGRVVGLDFSRSMLNEGEKKIQGYPQASLIQGNAMELPFEDNSFDFVTIGFGLRNVPDYVQVLKEMNRVAKPGGLVVCLDTSKPTLPVIKQMYWFYFSTVMPMMGRLFADSYEQYSWLQESTKAFPGRRGLVRCFFQAGFTKVRVKAYALGAAAAHFAVKPGGE
ncbi:demethylmenaquinone methyltransferase [Alkalicoccus chagannorensis]|uniref:demethylmenaquinone methyltransferase n=1 Tax=Alkalicoccus chagannorensis TaxID=427072 RepID=UPI0003FCBC88|nr:demethylmenaquinone methyltransferase [Alkalicoccus chagannorensis]